MKILYKKKRVGKSIFPSRHLAMKRDKKGSTKMTEGMGVSVTCAPEALIPGQEKKKRQHVEKNGAHGKEGGRSCPSSSQVIMPKQSRSRRGIAKIECQKGEEEKRTSLWKRVVTLQKGKQLRGAE